MTNFLTWYNMISEGTGKKKVPSTYSLNHTMTEKQSHPSLSVCWLSPYPQTSSTHGITPQSKLQNRDPFLDLHHQLTLFPSWVASSTAQPESVSLSGWGHYSAQICTEVLSKPRAQLQSPQALPSDLFWFSLHCCYNNLTVSPENAKVRVRQAAGRKRSSRERNPTGKTCQLLV